MSKSFFNVPLPVFSINLYEPTNPSFAILNNENLLTPLTVTLFPTTLYWFTIGKYSSGIYDQGDDNPPSLAAKFNVLPIILSGTVIFQFLIKTGTFPVAIPKMSIGSVFGLTCIPDNVGLLGSTLESTKFVLPKVSSTSSAKILYVNSCFNLLLAICIKVESWLIVPSLPIGFGSNKIEYGE